MLDNDRAVLTYPIADACKLGLADGVIAALHTSGNAMAPCPLARKPVGRGHSQFRRTALSRKHPFAVLPAPLQNHAAYCKCAAREPLAECKRSGSTKTTCCANRSI